MKKLRRSHWCMIATAVVLVAAIIIHLSCCSNRIYATDLMEGITANPVQASSDLRSGNPVVTDFAVRLLQAGNAEGENTLLSPLSVLYALAMTANGAEGETRTQMEQVLGMPVEEFNLYLYSYMQSQNGSLKLANSIWFNADQRFTANREFLQTNADYYGASLYKASFDNRTLKDINTWVEQNTDGMIPEILDEIPEEAVMYLINALVFEAKWQEVYTKQQIKDGSFTKEDGTEQNVEFMRSVESWYLEDDYATGVWKYYEGRDYAFVALLPKEGITVSEYIATLNGDGLQQLLAGRTRATVETSLPKFETEFSADLAQVLAGMGMPDAFDEKEADFSRLGSSTAGNIFISRVLHKTFITVGEQGTKAGASTVVEMNDTGAMIVDFKRVHLDRPFVYMLVDAENNIPFFIGTMMDVG